MKYVIFSDPATGWVGEPIALIESNEAKLLDLKNAGLVPSLKDEDDRVQTSYRRAGGKRGGYCPAR